MENKKPQTIKTLEGDEHFSVGALIWKNKELLIMDRKLPPRGFAGIAGHIDESETPEEALRREIKEETGLDVLSSKLLFKKKIIQKEDCVFGLKKHFWYVYDVRCAGELKPSEHEVRYIKYMPREKIMGLYKKKKLDYAWVVIFNKLKII